MLGDSLSISARCGHKPEPGLLENLNARSQARIWNVELNVALASRDKRSRADAVTVMGLKNSVDNLIKHIARLTKEIDR